MSSRHTSFCCAGQSQFPFRPRLSSSVAANLDRLMLQYLIQHPERNFPDNARALRRLQSRLPEAFRTLEQIKPRLETRYLALVAARQRVAIPHAPAAAQRGISVDGWLSRTSHPSDNERNDRNLAAETTTQETDRNYALEIAKLEFGNWERAQLQRRQTVANTSGKGVVVDHTGTVIRRVPAEDPAVSRRSYYETVEERREREAREGDEDMMESIKALSMGIDLSQHNGSKRDSYNKRNSTSEYDFQGFPQHEVETRNRPIEGNWAGFYPTIPRSLHSQTVYVPAPPLPLLPTPPAFTSPPLPPKIPTSNAPALPPKVVEKPAAPATQPHQFSMPATLENGTRLRTLFLPSPLRDTFLAIAQDNTDANLETCGVLCGKLVQNALFVSRLVIPEQTATSDTCTTRDEEALFEYCHNEDLMVFGWIHTHPTQTCFMSSVDLHTHSGYQLMMAESIAIVCAPSKTPS